MHEARPLGGNEKAFWKLDQASPLTFTMLAKIASGAARLHDADLERALAALQRRNPLLRAQIELRNGQPWFVFPWEASPAPPIPFVRRHVPPAAWKEAVEDEMRGPVPTERTPMGRAVLFDHGDDSATFVIFYHHSIGDGAGALAALRDVLWEAVTGAPRVATVHTRSLASESSLPPRARGVMGGFRRLRTVAGIAADGFRHRDPVKPPLLRAAAPHERTYHVELRDLDAEATLRLAARAREAGATVHGAVAAAIIFGIARAAGIQGERVVAFGSPINVRDRLVPSPGEQMGLYLGVSQFRGTVSPRTSFWELARAVRERIADDLESGRAVDSLPLIDLFYNAIGGDKASREDFGRKWAESNGTGGLTNVGRLELEPPPGLAIERVLPFGFPSGLDVLNGLASSYAGRLTLGFNWAEPCFERSGALALVDDVVATLTASVTSDPRLGASGAGARAAAT
jgi:hypothetical protein